MKAILALLAVALAVGCAGALAGGSFNPFEQPSTATPKPTIATPVRQVEIATPAETERGCLVTFYREADRLLELRCLAPAPSPAGTSNLQPWIYTRFCVVRANERLVSVTRELDDRLYRCEVAAARP